MTTLWNDSKDVWYTGESWAMSLLSLAFVNKAESSYTYKHHGNSNIHNYYIYSRM